jgi:flagella basal body P-ring formation protein FlgA
MRDNLKKLHARLLRSTAAVESGIVLSMLAFSFSPTWAQTLPAAKPQSFQNLDVLTQKVKEFLMANSATLAGQVNVSVVPADQKLKLASCESIEAFFPGTSKAWGKTSVGLRCHDDAVRWVVYLQGNVSVYGNFLVAATNLGQGQVIGARDVKYQRGDLTTLPPNIFTNETQVIGLVSRIAMNVGTILKQEMAALPIVVKTGQQVRILSSGNGFTISAEGRAQNNATQGQMVQVRVASGQTISGLASANGQVEIKID